METGLVCLLPSDRFLCFDLLDDAYQWVTYPREKTRRGRLVEAPFMTAILRSSLGTARRLAFLRSRAPGIRNPNVHFPSNGRSIVQAPDGSQYTLPIRLRNSARIERCAANHCLRLLPTECKATHRENNRAAARFLYIRLNMLGTQQSASHANRESRLNSQGR